MDSLYTILLTGLPFEWTQITTYSLFGVLLGACYFLIIESVFSRGVLGTCGGIGNAAKG